MTNEKSNSETRYFSSQSQACRQAGSESQIRQEVSSKRPEAAWFVAELSGYAAALN